MKYTNFLSKLGRFLFLTLMFTVTVLPFPAIIIGVIVLECVGITEVSFIIPLVIPVCFAVSALSLNYFLSWLNNAKFVNTGYVRDGRTVIDVVRDASYYKRATIVYYIHSILSVVALVYLFAKYGFILFSIIPGIFGVIGLIVEAIIYFLLAKSSQEKHKIERDI